MIKSETTAWIPRHYKYSLLLDGLGLVILYLIPTLSHLTGIPFYLFEPMRIIIVLSLLHSRRYNSYLLAIGLPLFSFFISAHPVFLKALLIAVELSFNVWLFYGLKRKKWAFHWAVVISVVTSKLVYYLFKFILIKFTLLESSLISTPIYLQVFTTSLFGAYAFLWFRNKNFQKIKK
jgi:hypothetical protein